MDAETVLNMASGALYAVAFWVGYWWRGKRRYSYTDTCGIGACQFEVSSSNPYILTQVLEHHRGTHPRLGLDE